MIVNYTEAKAIREYQLNGGRVSETELREAIAILSAPRTPRANMTNPWHLTPGMIRALEAYIAAGTTQGAAEVLRANHKTISHQLTCAKDRIGASNLVLAALTLDRYLRTRSTPCQ